MSDVPVVLGINPTQGASVCLMQGSRPLWAIQQERLSRRKHHRGKPGRSAVPRPPGGQDHV